jgi:hypothetical protein
MTVGLIQRARYSGPEKFDVVRIDVPEIGDDDVLVRSRGSASGGYFELNKIRLRYQHVESVEQYDPTLKRALFDMLTPRQDLHYHKGEFLAKVSAKFFTITCITLTSHSGHSYPVHHSIPLQLISTSI